MIISIKLRDFSEGSPKLCMLSKQTLDAVWSTKCIDLVRDVFGEKREGFNFGSYYQESFPIGKGTGVQSFGSNRSWATSRVTFLSETSD